MKQPQFFAIAIAIAGTAAYWIGIAGVTGYLSQPALASSSLKAASAYLPVTLTVTGDNQGDLREFPLNNDASHYRAYIQARQNERYRLRVTNNSEQRVGLVIAVDGRNIISGKKSWLGNNERMYILDPHDSADYDGWRSTTNQTNRFYFTNVSDSYAAAWGDTSAMGVIAMAVYSERPRPEVYYNKDNVVYGPPSRAGKGFESPRPPAAAESSSMRARAQADAAAPAPGTGYGENSYSPAVSVTFEPSPNPLEKIVLKYEWRETLCRKNILPECNQNDDDRRENRFWQNDNNDFAPPPPTRY